MKKTNKFQTVKDVIELIESIPRWQVEIKVHFVEGDDPNLCKHIWTSSIEEFKRVVPKTFYDLRISSYKLTREDGFCNSVEYLISIDTKYYGFNVEELKQLFILNRQILSSTEDIEVQTAKLDRIDTWSRKLAEELNISPQTVIAVRDKFILLQRAEFTKEENNVLYTTIADRVKFDEKGIYENRLFIRAMERIINTKNKEVKR